MSCDDLRICFHEIFDFVGCGKNVVSSCSTTLRKYERRQKNIKLLPFNID
jgi:hypothetical protein